MEDEKRVDTTPKKTWFFERESDGQVIPTNEAEAWEIMNNPPMTGRPRMKLIGVSDGTTYSMYIKQNMSVQSLAKSKYKALEAELERYLQTEEKFKYEELLDEDSPKMLRLKAKIDEVEKKLETAHAEWKSISGGVIAKAFEAELEAARGHIERPSNKNVMTPDPKRRDEIMSLLPKQ